MGENNNTKSAIPHLESKLVTPHFERDAEEKR